MRSRSTELTPATAFRTGIRSSAMVPDSVPRTGCSPVTVSPARRAASSTSGRNLACPTARMTPTGSDCEDSLTGPGADPSRRPRRVRQRERTRQEAVFEVGRRGVGVGFGEQCEDTRDVRRGHAGARLRLVPIYILYSIPSVLNFSKYWGYNCWILSCSVSR